MEKGIALRRGLLPISILILGILTLPALALRPGTQPPTKVANAVWANGRIYDTQLLGDIKYPNPNSLDRLYNFDSSGLNGQRSVAEAAPGDPNYNGGRWAVIPVTFTPEGKLVHDPDNDGNVNFELMSEEQIINHVALGHITLGEPIRYFICPLLPHGH